MEAVAFELQIIAMHCSPQLGFIEHNRWKFGEQLLRRNQSGNLGPEPLSQFFQTDCGSFRKLSDSSAPQSRQMRSAAKPLADLVGQRTDIRSGRDLRLKTGFVPRNPKKLQVVDGYTYRNECYRQTSAR